MLPLKIDASTSCSLATPIGCMASADVKELQRIAKKLCAKETCAIQSCLQGIYNNYQVLDKLQLNVAVLCVHVEVEKAVGQTIFNHLACLSEQISLS